MSDQSDLSKPLNTWSHLAGKRRRPSDYEIVSTNLLWGTEDAKGAARAFRVPLGFTT